MREMQKVKNYKMQMIQLPGVKDMNYYFLAVLFVHNCSTF